MAGTPTTVNAAFLQTVFLLKAILRKKKKKVVMSWSAWKLEKEICAEKHSV